MEDSINDTEKFDYENENIKNFIKNVQVEQEKKIERIKRQILIKI